MTVKNSRSKVKSYKRSLKPPCGYSSKFKVFRAINFALLIATLHFTLCTLRLDVANAQTLSLSLWPPLLEAMIRPGRAVTAVYKLTNNSDHELSITPQIFPFEPTGEEGQIRLRPAPPTSRLSSSFFSFDSGEKFGQPFPLPIGQTREMVLKIAIPPDNQEKDYYYTLLFASAEESLNPSGKEAHSQAGSVTQIGTNILITVSQLGKPVLLGKIVSFSAPTIIDSFSGVEFNLVLENWGNTLWKPFGRIKATGLLKQSQEIKLKEQNVLAGSSRRLQIDPWRPRLPLGPFKANLDFSLNEDGPKLFTQISFWYLPYKAVGLFCLFSLVIFVTKRIKKRLKPGQCRP